MAEHDRSMSASRTISAPAERIFAFLACPANHRVFDTSGMLRSAPDQPRIDARGQSFLMNMRNDVMGDHQTENHVVVYESGRAIGWAPAEPGQPPAGHTWVWRLDPDGDRTEVSQTYDWSQFSHVDATDDDLPVIDRDQLQQSLTLLARAVEEDQ